MTARGDSFLVCDTPDTYLLTLRRPYKHAAPDATVSRIKGILTKLDCDAHEIHWANPYSGIYSVRVETELRNGNFGQNGKGKTKAYTLASAYAELMERIQNGMLNGFARLFNEQNRNETGFCYYPDERILPQEEFDSLPPAYLADIGAGPHGSTISNEYYERLRKNGYAGPISVPFFDSLSRNIVYLPYNLTIGMIGSNGMAAGNTVTEAVFQGLCELYERFACAIIYNRRLTPPTVPRRFLAEFPDEWNIIQEIERSGHYEVIVKDFSCGQKFPVLGVIIQNKDRTLYRLNAGADTSFGVALSRGLTEIHQGYMNLDDFAASLLPIPRTEHEYFLNDNPASIVDRRRELLQFTINGKGVFPRSLFESNQAYTFDPSAFVSRSSYEEEVRYLIGLFHSLGHNVYLRDVSFLGFPSVLVYVPVVSHIGKKSMGPEDAIGYAKLFALDEIEDLFFPFQACTPEKMLRLATILEANRGELMKDMLKFEATVDSPWSDIPVSFFLTLCWYKLGRPRDALRNLKAFMVATKNDADEYYKVVARFLELAANGRSSSEIAEQLGIDGYSESLRQEVVGAFADGKHLFDAIDIPNCPHCSACPIRRGCVTAGKVEVTKRINRLMQTSIEQRHFETLVA
jgi:YcaO-like protein with predicted kinase domain